MLGTLRIENFLIVKELEIDFAEGMTTFTGETGAGKSIMIDALSLALGNRADTHIIRKGQETCIITAIFYTDLNSEPAQWLLEHDIALNEGQIILRRTFSREGRSRMYINGQVFPLQKVKELSESLVHIHGQHEHQELMHPATHRKQLDHFAQHSPLLHQVEEAYKRCIDIKRQLHQLQNQASPQDKITLLEFQIQELQALHLQEHEVTQLNREHQNLYHAYDYLQHCEQIQQLLEGENAANIQRSINQVLHLLEHLPKNHPVIQNTLDLMQNALIQCDEACTEMNHFRETVQVDPERLQAVDQRLSALHQMARKYQVEPGNLLTCLNTLEQELQALQAVDEKVATLNQAYEESHSQYIQLATQLTQARTQAAKKLSEEITLIIQQLGMPHGQIIVEITALNAIHAHGLDKIEYKVATNKGMEPDLLSKIASGGELSRISLAIQVITAQRGSTPTLLFDEVDVGVGGSTAALIGRLLRSLGERLQVFCVTHQAQVAAYAHNHFVVEKYSDTQETFSRIIAIQDTQKINEIARMLGGLKITEQTRSHAQELLQQSHLMGLY